MFSVTFKTNIYSGLQYYCLWKPIYMLKTTDLSQVIHFTVCLTDTVLCGEIYIYMYPRCLLLTY